MRGIHIAVTVSALAVSACASKQLNYNTVDIASSIENIYTQQALNNLSKIIEQPYAIPSQLDIAAGTIQTSNAITPTLTFPISQSVSTAVSATTTKTTATAGSSLALGASDSWQQNWTVSPITDANTLRNLQALYRSVIEGPEILKADYHTPRIQNSDGSLKNSPYYQAEPHCVLCTAAEIPNAKLPGLWLYWTSDSGSATPEHMPPDRSNLMDLGHYGNHELFMTQQDYRKGYLANFVLFIMPVAEPTPSQPASNGKQAGGGAATPRHNYNLFVPQSILPGQ